MLSRTAWRSPASFPPPPQAELCLARGNKGTAVNTVACRSPQAAALAASAGPEQEPAETPATSGCPRSRKRRRGARCGRYSLVTAARRFSLAARLYGQRPSHRLIFHAPQTASLGDARVCAVPLKAAGSVLLSFSTGCQNMQIRGPESAAKSRRRGAAGASPDPLLVWLFPAWPAAPRPSLQPPGPLPRPAGLTLPPTPPGRPLAPLGREPGAGGAACPDSGRSRGPLQSAPSPRRSGGGEPGGAAPPRYTCGEPGGSGGRGGVG